MKFLVALLFLVCSPVLAFNTVTLYGGNEVDQPVRLAHTYDMSWDRFRVAGVTNLDEERYQVKPRLTFDVVGDVFKLQLVYQHEWFQWQQAKREIQMSTGRYGVGVRSNTGPVRHELNLYAYDDQTGRARVEDFVTVRFDQWSLNNQVWWDVENQLWFNQFTLSYRIAKNFSIVAQHQAQANRDDIVRGGIAWTF